MKSRFAGLGQARACRQKTHRMTLERGVVRDKREKVEMCLCVCVLTLLHIKYHDCDFTSKAGPVWLVFTTSKDCFRVQTWFYG